MAEWDDDEAEELVPLGATLAGADLAADQVAEAAARAALERGRPPSAVDQERALLGAAMLDDRCVGPLVDLGLLPDHFYREAHGLIWGAILSLHARRDPVDSLTVADELLKSGQLDAAGGAHGIGQLVATLASSAGSLAYARNVMEQAALRAVITLAKDAATKAYKRSTPAAEIAHEAAGAFSELVARGSVTAGRMSNADAAEEALATAPITGAATFSITTGIPSLDRAMGGLTPGTLTIVAARPSMGKSQLVLDWLDELSVVRGKRCMFFSLEMSHPEVFNRMAGARSGVSMNRKGAPPAERAAFARAMAEISGSPLIVDENAAQTISTVRSRARAEHHRGPLSLVVVDYLQLMSFDGGAKGDDANTNTQVGKISKGLKLLARELKVPVVALSQLNRGVESRPNKHPTMSDLRDSGAIEQDADKILFLYREEYYARAATPADKRGVCEIDIAKYRNGRAGITVLTRFVIGDDDAAPPPRFRDMEQPKWG